MWLVCWIRRRMGPPKCGTDSIPVALYRLYSARLLRTKLYLYIILHCFQTVHKKPERVPVCEKHKPPSAGGAGLKAGFAGRIYALILD